MKALGARGRRAAYAVALAATLLAVRWAGGQDETLARPAREMSEERAAPRAAPREALPPLDIALLGARASGASVRDLFPAVNWERKAREEEARRNPPSKPAPPRPPQAPPVPFTYLGKLVEDGKATVFLVQGERNLIVREGETLAGGWRVDAIGEQSMTLTYVSLDQQRTLSFAAPPAGGQPGRGGAPAPRDGDDDRKDE